MDRSSGILLHISSLPGRHGIGDLGPAAYAWVDQLAHAKQSWWQMLPLGPTGYADSPYQCLSAFAGNPNFISLERVADDGLLAASDLPHENVPLAEVDYDRVTPLKLQATLAAYAQFKARRVGSAHHANAFDQFCRAESEWLDAFALFVALKERNAGVAWWEWPMQQRTYASAMAETLTPALVKAIDLCKFRQFLFFRQWQELREYAHSHGIKLIGDMPIFIARDSADVWSRPELFQLDEHGEPAFVAGVPPDYFSQTGQLWGNPLYDWQQHRATGYAWWISRLQSSLKLVDLIRLDHFRGFEAYWAVPAGSATAEPGSWVKGPGADLFKSLNATLGGLPLIAEDLGVITPEVNSLRHEFKLPGMRILQFAFGGAQEDRFFPHRYDQHTVVYTGTHDNETTVGWFENLSNREREFFNNYAPGAIADPAWTLIRLAWASVADLAITPLQDILRLDNNARMNTPGTTNANWRWRLQPGELTDVLLEPLGQMTDTYQRTRTLGIAPCGES